MALCSGVCHLNEVEFVLLTPLLALITRDTS
jgi:hypothetical protein